MGIGVGRQEYQETVAALGEKSGLFKGRTVWPGTTREHGSAHLAVAGVDSAPQRVALRRRHAAAERLAVVQVVTADGGVAAVAAACKASDAASALAQAAGYWVLLQARVLQGGEQGQA